MEELQVAREDAFELGTVTAAVRPAAVVKDAVVVDELVQGGLRDVARELEVGAVGGGAVELGETAEDDALIVGPCSLGGVSLYVPP